jgi:methylenetetrahydrofolate dehydrogenase (NADP+) / methenyltetrahydrofolate cyclohydrolase
MKIDGKLITDKILVDLKLQTDNLKKKDIVPHLVIIIIGNDPSSFAYVRQKELKAKKVGIKTTIIRLPEATHEKDLIKTIQQYNDNDNVHGIIVQQPLPQKIDTKITTQAIDPAKDVDGFHSDSKFEMPISMAVFEVLEGVAKEKNWLKNKNIVIIGKGKTGGKPIINALQKIGISPSVINSKTKSPESITQKADIIISAVGKPNIVTPEMIKKGVILIGIGQSRQNGKVVGDFDEEKIKDIASFYTPTPGGLGPVDVTMLLKNTIKSAEDSTGIYQKKAY